MTYERRPSAPTTARARARAELTREILASAKRQLVEVGGAGLSLRAVARDLGMVSSAVYRYYASRDELLTALIIDAYDAVGEAAERAAASSRGSTETRFLAVADAIWQWARDHPHEYALVYGTPVPGYVAPTDTVDPGIRVSLAALGVFVDGMAAGEVVTTMSETVSHPVEEAFGRLRAAIDGELDDEVLTRVMAAWAATFGTISLLLFGHLHGMVDDHDAFFDHEMRRMVRYAVSGT